MKRILLFDVDGTLVDTGGAGRTAFERTFEKVFGVADAFRGIPFSGRTDPWILEAGARGAFGRPPSADETVAFFASYPEVLAAEVESSPGYRACPGVEVLLEGLAERPDCFLGLCTGNLEFGARCKLARVGLDRYFAFGGFASDSADRAELTRVALSRGRERAGRDAPAFVVGDSVHDARAARANGLPIALVATGRTTLEELSRESPDLLFPSLEDWGVAVARLLGLGDDLRAGTGALDLAVERTRSGGVLLYPTAGLYGIGGNALDPGVAERVRAIKGGARAGPFLVLAGSADAALALADEVPDEAGRLADAFWPGPLTLVLAAAPGLPESILGPGGTVAIRVDAHPFARNLPAAAGVPILSTSANRSGDPPPARREEVAAVVAAGCDLVILDDRPLEGLPSTLVRADGTGVSVLRAGAVTEAAIRQVLEEEEASGGGRRAAGRDE